MLACTLPRQRPGVAALTHAPSRAHLLASARAALSAAGNACDACDPLDNFGLPDAGPAACTAAGAADGTATAAGPGCR